MIAEGDPTVELFALVDGALVATTVKDGLRVDLARLTPGDLVGEVSLVAKTARSATVTADGPARVVRIERADALAWFDRFPDDASAMVAESRRRMNLRQVAVAFPHLLGDTVLAEFGERIDWRYLSAGETLFFEGDAADEMFLILSGRLAVELDDGGERRQRSMGRGEVVGELGVLAGFPRSATVRATRDATLAVVGRELIVDLVGRRPDLVFDLTRTAIARMNSGRPQRAPTALTVVALDEGATDVAAALVDSLGADVRVAHVTAERIDADLGREGLAGSDSDDVGLPRLGEYLYEIENGHDVVVRSCGPELGGWARRALHAADRILLVTSPGSAGPIGRRVDEVLRLRASGIEADPSSVWLVVRHERWTRTPSGSAELRRTIGNRVGEIHHLRLDRSDDVDRLGRLATGRGVGLVFGGGGARGFAHLGAWRAYRELGLVADRIAGASIGAPLAAGLAQGVELDEMVPLTEGLFHRLLDYTVPVVALLKGERITASIQEAFEGWDVEDLWLPYFCVSSSLTHSSTFVHRRGDLSTAVRASVAIPGILPPVPLDDELLVDGGVLDNLPVEPLADDPSIGEIVAFDVAPEAGLRPRRDYGLHVPGWKAFASTLPGRRSVYPSVSNVMLRSMMLGSAQQRNQMMAGNRVDFVLEMALHGVALLDFDKVAEVAAAGYEAAIGPLSEYAAGR